MLLTHLAGRHHYLKQDDPSGLVPLGESASQLVIFWPKLDPIAPTAEGGGSNRIERYSRSGFSSHEVPSPAGRAGWDRKPNGVQRDLSFYFLNAWGSAPSSPIPRESTWSAVPTLVYCVELRDRNQTSMLLLEGNNDRKFPFPRSFPCFAALYVLHYV